MNRFIVFLFISLLLISCSKEDVICEFTTLELCNPTINKIVVYNIATGSTYDTLFPGECKTSIHGNLESKGSRVVNYNTPKENINIELISCNLKINAPGDYFDFDHCFNKYFNPEEGELDTDCGGDCKPCEKKVLSCESNFNNSLKWSNKNKTLKQIATFFGDKIDNKEIIVFRFSSGEELMLALPSFHLGIPTKSERLLIGKQAYHAEAWYVDQFGNNFVEAIKGQSIYFEVNDVGKKYIKFCDVNFDYDNGAVISGSAKLEVD